MDALLNLSLDFQIILVAGYLGFWIATVGIDQKITPTHIAMQVLVYGFFAKMSLLVFEGLGVQNKVLPSLFAVFVSVFIGCAWRGLLRKWTTDFFKYIGVYQQDHLPSVRASILEEANAKWECVQVYTTDGKIYESNFNFVPKGLLTGSFMYDQDGNISMYLTKLFLSVKDEEPRTFEDNNLELGNSLTYIPSEQIIRVNICWHPEDEKGQALDYSADERT